MTAQANYNPAVMASRLEPPDSLDFFPTPPWGTRALCEMVIPNITGKRTADCIAWDPAAGEGHMSDVLAEYFRQVHETDVFDYGHQEAVRSYVGVGPDVMIRQVGIDWVITNPPFNKAFEFIERALSEAIVGVAMLGRLQLSESAERYPLFTDRRFAAIAPFAGRLPMVKGQWDPAATSATGYAWFVWLQEHRTPIPPGVIMIPPTARNLLWHDTDVARFAGPRRCGVAGLSKKKRGDYGGMNPAAAEI
jgi:hypothetical protein